MRLIPTEVKLIKQLIKNLLKRQDSLSVSKISLQDSNSPQGTKLCCSASKFFSETKSDSVLKTAIQTVGKSSIKRGICLYNYLKIFPKVFSSTIIHLTNVGDAGKTKMQANLVLLWKNFTTPYRCESYFESVN